MSESHTSPETGASALPLPPYLTSPRSEQRSVFDAAFALYQKAAAQFDDALAAYPELDEILSDEADLAEASQRLDGVVGSLDLYAADHPLCADFLGGDFRQPIAFVQGNNGIVVVRPVEWTSLAGAGLGRYAPQKRSFNFLSYRLIPEADGKITVAADLHQIAQWADIVHKIGRGVPYLAAAFPEMSANGLFKSTPAAAETSPRIAIVPCVEDDRMTGHCQLVYTFASEDSRPTANDEENVLQSLGLSELPPPYRGWERAKIAAIQLLRNSATVTAMRKIDEAAAFIGHDVQNFGSMRAADAYLTAQPARMMADLAEQPANTLWRWTKQVGRAGLAGIAVVSMIDTIADIATGGGLGLPDGSEAGGVLLSVDTAGMPEVAVNAYDLGAAHANNVLFGTGQVTGRFDTEFLHYDAPVVGSADGVIANTETGEIVSRYEPGITRIEDSEGTL